MKNSGYKNIESVVENCRDSEMSFAVATVVRTNASTAAKPGMKAVISESGDILAGWLGGGCVTSAVKKAALKAISDGKPNLVILRPEEMIDETEEAHQEEDHIMLARNGCPSKGSLDIFVEPFVPLPEIVVFGTSPVANAFFEIASKFSYHVKLGDVVDSRESKASEPLSPGVPLKTAGRLYIVLATQGKSDMSALRTALKMSASYVGFVASQKKFATLRSKLEKEGFEKSQLARVKAPAGLDLGSITPEEIALSIMAEITQHHRANIDVFARTQAKEE